MTNLGQDIPCDLTMGFSLDMLLDLINSVYCNITIDTTSADIISNSYKYAFESYFKSKDDKVVVHLPRNIKVIDDQQFETITWGTATLQGGSKSYILKLAHHYYVKYLLQDPYNKKAAIQLDYNGTEVYVVEGGKLDEVPTRMIRQAIQSSIKKINVPPILLEPPNIDLPFADIAVDLRRLTISGNKQSKEKDNLYFEVVINDKKHLLGKFETQGSASIDLNLTYLLKKGNNPLHISAQGINLGEKNDAINFLGSAAVTHSELNRRILSHSLIGTFPAMEWELCQDLINANIKYNYSPVQALINPIMECFGAELKTYEEVQDAVSNDIYKPFLSSKPDYKLEYTIRRLNPVDISINFLGLFLNAASNSFYLKFDYIIDGIDDNLSSTTTSASSFSYPHGQGIMISEVLLKKIFKAHWEYSCLMPKTFCSDYNKLFALKEDNASYSLSMNSPELFIDSSKLKIVASIKPISKKYENKGPKERNKIKNATKQVTKVDPYCALKKVKIDTDISLSESNRLDITLGKIKPGIDHDQPHDRRKHADPFYDKIVNIASGTRINLLTLPKELTISKHNCKISYDDTNVNLNDITIGSWIYRQKTSPATSEKPTLPPAKKVSGIMPIVPKDKWGHEGTTDGHFNVPGGIAISKTKSGLFIYVVDRDNNRVQKFDGNGKFIQTWGTKGSGDGELSYPTDITIDKDGSSYVVDSCNNRVQKFDPDGHFKTKFGSKGNGNGHFFFPQGIAVDETGCIYVTDTNHLVQQFDANCKFVKQWGGPGDKKGQFHSPRGITLSKKGFLYVSDAGNHRIQKFSVQGKFISKWGNKGTDNGQLSFPQGLALDSNENLYVTDTGNNRIQIFNPKGKYITKFSSEGSSIGNSLAPLGIAIDKNSDIYITDSFNYRIQKFGR